ARPKLLGRGLVLMTSGVGVRKKPRISARTRLRWPRPASKLETWRSAATFRNWTLIMSESSAPRRSRRAMSGIAALAVVAGFERSRGSPHHHARASQVPRDPGRASRARDGCERNAAVPLYPSGMDPYFGGHAAQWGRRDPSRRR